LEKLGDALVGKKAGDKVSVEAEVADDHPNADWRGKSAQFEFVIHDVKRLVLPKVDEVFLSGMGFETEEEFRGWVRDDMAARLGDAIRDGLRGQVREYLLENTKVELPKGLSHRQAERAAELRKIEMRRRGVPDSEIDKHLDELRVQARTEAVSDLKLFFIMEKLSEELDVHVGEDELNGQIALMAQRYNRRFDRMRDELARGEGLTHLYLQMRDEKIVDVLITKARIVETEGPKKQAAKESPKKATTKKGSSASKSKQDD
jgi:trigger factor